MAIDINLYTNNSAPEVMDKDLTTLSTLTGTLKEPTTFVDPVVLIETTHDIIRDCNYIRITQFGRFYFVREIAVVRTGLYQLSCHVDVLMSFRADIRKNKAIIHRSEKSYELMLDDGSIKVNNNPTVQTKSFPNGFTTSLEFVLAVAGGSGA